MVIIGLVGGVASGKSVVARQLSELGAEVLDGDRIGHEVLGIPRVQEKLVARWGREVLSEDGHMNRAAIAQRVFADSAEGAAELAFLESVTHPEIGRLLHERIDQMVTSGNVRGVVVDAAVMMKAGWDRFCNHIIFVDVPRELRLERALKRGMSAEQFARREAAQIAVDTKRTRADTVIDNSGSVAQTRQQVRDLWRAMLAIE